MPTASPQKVFCIGFHKTGTKSLGHALEILGLRVTGPVKMQDPVSLAAMEARCLPLLSEFDAVQDNPWPFLYPRLDQLYPGAKFILTRRPPDTWIDSVVSHFGSSSTPMRCWIYGVGSPKGNEPIYIRRCQQHTEEVMRYFRARPRDLLVWDLTLNPDWSCLCSFLQRPVPNLPFPHLNQRSQRFDGSRASSDS